MDEQRATGVADEDVGTVGMAEQQEGSASTVVWVVDLTLLAALPVVYGAAC